MVVGAGIVVVELGTEGVDVVVEVGEVGIAAVGVDTVIEVGIVATMGVGTVVLMVMGTVMIADIVIVAMNIGFEEVLVELNTVVELAVECKTAVGTDSHNYTVKKMYSLTRKDILIDHKDNS